MDTGKAPPTEHLTPLTADVEGQSAIKEALQQFGANRDQNQENKHQTRGTLQWLYLTAAIAFALTSMGLQQGLIAPVETLLPLFQRLSFVGLLVSSLFAFRDFLANIWIKKISSAPSRYNLSQLLSLITWFATFIAVASVMFANWTAGLVSLGVLSVVLGLALQAPLSNLFAWFYILVRQPYRVGDRIRINDATGDVIDVGYFDTTLWEFGGQYLSTDHPSGRIIQFPNSLVLNGAVYNYSWPLFPYIWNEVHIYVAYDSDLDFVAETMIQVAMQELGSEMPQRVDMYRDLLSHTPVDEIEVNEKPVVLFRAHENTWIEAIVRFLVEPKQAGPVKTRILKQCLLALNAEPARVLFPQGNAR